MKVKTFQCLSVINFKILNRIFFLSNVRINDWEKKRINDFVMIMPLAKEILLQF